MTNYDLEEAELIKWQMVLTILFIFSFILSISLSYNELLKHVHKTPLYTKKTEKNILIINRSLAFFITLGFLYLNWVDKQIKGKYNQPHKYSDLQISASMITLVATIIVLYVAIDSNNGSVAIQNPEL